MRNSPHSGRDCRETGKVVLHGVMKAVPIHEMIHILARMRLVARAS